MPSIDVSFLRRLRGNFKDYPVFVETGTLEGSTTFACEPHFEKVYTIEVDKSLYDRVSSRYTGNKITFLHGDSSSVFESLLPQIDKPSIFFLDGHWSGGGTGKGAKDCPLIEEISLISTLLTKPAIIIIDDYRLFGKSPKTRTCNEDWEGISKEKILNILGNRVEVVYHLESNLSPDDRLIIHIR